MPGTFVGELIAMVGEVALRAVIAGPVREWRLSSFYEELSREHKMAFLEVGCAAIMHDGAVSESEEEWLERRRAASDSDAELVDAAMRVTKEALPTGSDDAAFTAFIAKRAEQFETDKQREWVYTAAQILLRACGAKPATSKLFAEALGLPPEKYTVVDARLASGLK